MKVSINNKEVETDAVTLLQLTTELSLPAQGVAVAANNRMIPRTEWADYALSEGISIVIIKSCLRRIGYGKGSVHYTLYRKVFLPRLRPHGFGRRLPLDTATYERCDGKRNTARSRGSAKTLQRLWRHIHHRRPRGTGKGNPGGWRTSRQERYACCRSAAHTRRGIYHRRYSQHVRRRKETLARRSKLHRLRTVQIYHHQAETQPLFWVWKDIKKLSVKCGQIISTCLSLLSAGLLFADIPSVMQTGVTGIALSGTVLRADNPVEEMQRILTETNQAGKINQTANY